METCQEIIIKGLLITSVAALLVPFLIIRFRRVIEKKSHKTFKRAGVSGMLIASACLIVSVWCLRYAVGYFSIINPTSDTPTLTLWEEFFNSIIHSLQTFSMDESYTDYILNGKKMVAALVCEKSVWVNLYGVYVSFLNIAAPIAGGAIILEIISSIFPKIKLIFSYINIRRKKYFFSELNPASLALAKSISIENRSENPLIIFTDTYIDDEKEKEYELLLEAKQIGAVCVRDDLEHVIKPWTGKSEYYLMDENEFGNLQTLTELVKKPNFRFIRNSHIYLFVQSDAYVQIEKQVNLKLDAAKEKKQFKGKKPMIIPIYGYRNLVQNLLVDVPLYEPLVHKTDNTGLTVTILGNGVIGTEAFLSTYWLGQMMVSQKKDNKETIKECDLTINIVSKDTEKDFWAKIDYINPDIRKTVEVSGEFASKSSEKYLVFNNNGEKNNPYCKVQYIQADLKIGSFWDEVSEDTQKLFNSDYFIVALGNDSDNISIAENLRCYISKKHIEEGTNGNSRKTVIAYAVFDSELSASLNNQKYFKIRQVGTTDIYMHAFGDLEQVYSCKNVYISKNKILSAEAGKAFLNGQYNDSHHQDNKNRISFSEKIDSYEDSNYNYWANIARAMHVKYKVFSLGWINTSIFDCSSEEESEKHRENVCEQCRQYLTFAAVKNKDMLTANDKDRYDEIELKKEYLAWLEHRRWCAFTRTMGYQYVDIQKILAQNGNHKDMRLKLHACLIEAVLPNPCSADRYMSGVQKKSEQTDEKFNNACRDFLDIVSYIKGGDDFKTWDYYKHELDNFKFESELVEELRNAEIPSPEKYCNHDRIKESICCNTVNGKVYLIPKEAVKGALEKKYRIISEGENVKCAFIFDKTKYATKSDAIFATISQVFCK